MRKSIHRARYVLAESCLLMQDAAVCVSDSGQISDVGAWTHAMQAPGVEVIDWGHAVIIPGMVNAHAHLELTAFHNQITRFRSFTDWISQLIDKRRLWSEDDFIRSVGAGAEAALSSGTTLIGDVTASGRGSEGGCGSGLRRVVFEEITALSPANLDSALSQMRARIDRPHHDPLLIRGVSPHAPYSVSPELYRGLADLSGERGLLLATHVAETPGEIRFLQSGKGEFREFLLRLGALPAAWRPPQQAPIAYLDSLGVLKPSTVLIHCNYLDQDSMRRISEAKASVVFCPRSHDFFGHDPHPVRRLLDLGINVALGTDSLASNSSLSMLDEMRHLSRTRGDLRPEEIFRAATLNGAAALHFTGRLGRLQPGYLADMAVLGLPEGIQPSQLLSQVLEGAGECVASVVQGNIAWCRPGFR